MDGLLVCKMLRPMVIAIISNVLNIVLSFTFVYGFDMKIKGIAGHNAFAGDNTSYFYRFWLRYYRRLLKYIDNYNTMLLRSSRFQGK